MAKKGQEIGDTLNELRRKNSLLFVALIMLVILIVFGIILFASQSQRSAIYRDSSGAAGLHATIDYTCLESCENKYGFNVYILTTDGRQVSVVRPNSEGEVNLALAEGDYVMLIGKQFGNDDVFPQERLELKKGKTLELDVKY